MVALPNDITSLSTQAMLSTYPFVFSLYRCTFKRKSLAIMTASMEQSACDELPLLISIDTENGRECIQAILLQSCEYKLLSCYEYPSHHRAESNLSPEHPR